MHLSQIFHWLFIETDVTYRQVSSVKKKKRRNKMPFDATSLHTENSFLE